jgi:hypothetical protein
VTTQVLFSNISATTAPFALSAGNYVLFGTAANWGGGLNLQLLGPDGVTWLTVASASRNANGVSDAIPLPSGTYRVQLTTMTGLYLSISAVSGTP